MSRIAVVGEAPRLEAWALAGAIVVEAASEVAVHHAWDGLAEDVEVVIVTPTAAAQLGDRVNERLVVVLP